ncbi:MAG TPA: iron uptake transporter permease EfeU, partial [Nocardioides sp.]|nr:iron uptake transporter permease EfeU [Nocardioides sp.]
IGLREGLEAALIVGFIAVFLAQQGRKDTLRQVWTGVGIAVALCIVIGVALRVISQELPQQGQEGLETVVGALAVVMVTYMVLWMAKHSRGLKKELEGAAASALAQGSTMALVVMAFLAVLREGFETAVFLLATFEHATSAPTAVLGAVLGILVAVVLGYLIFAGGVRLNLQKFFSSTGIFLVFVAAGLVIFAARTAHEAGWLNIGQGRTVDLSWLAPNGSIRAALFTGVLGIQPDPRVVEALAWACYLIPMLVLMYLPARWRPQGALAQRLRYAGAALLTVVAAGLTVLVPAAATPRAELPATVDLTTLMTYNDGRVPVGLSTQSAPGPYAAAWRERAGSSYVLTITGGGLTVPRTYTVDVPTPGAADPGNNRPLWRRWFPLTLLVAAAALLGQAVRRRPSVTTPKEDHVPINA